MKHFPLKLFITIACIFLCSGSIIYGQRQISGKITDAESGEGLIGASVIVKGTTTGAITDVNGGYSVRLPNGATTLKVSYTGYADQEVAIGASNVLDVQLKPGAALEEVIVIGYGTVKKEDATGALLAVNSKSFNKGAVVAPQELISGKVAGVQITPSSDGAGSGTIRIRGGSSLTASNDPLIVIDGIPIDNNTVAGSRNFLNIVNPNDIESFTVLKDASATAIYGSRASNGVIIITTKKGTLNHKLRLDYSGLVSFNSKLNQVDVLTGDEFRALVTERYADGSQARSLLGTANTDWQKEIYQTGVTTDHNIGASGAIGMLPYRVSLGYTSRSSILKTDKLDRFTGAINLSPSFFKNALQVKVGAKLVSDKNRFANRDAIGAAAAFDPTQPIRAAGNDAYGGYFTWKDALGSRLITAPSNPVAALEQTDDSGTATRYILNGSADYRLWFLPDLHVNLNLGYDHSTSDGTVIRPANAAIASVTNGYDKSYAQTKDNKLLELYLNYTKKIDVNNKIDLLGGYSWQRFYITDYNYVRNTDGSQTIEPENYDPGEFFLLSLYGRLNYTFQDRYYLTATVRRDGSSRFAKDNRWGLFPSVALGWKIIDNKEAALSSLKLRLSYGETGQQDIGNLRRDYYAYQPTYVGSQPTAQYPFGNTYYTTLRPSGYDANIKWETTTTYNAGLDYGIMDNRVYGAIEVYQRKTKDLLNFVPVPAGTNLTNFITTNVGDLENKGVELSLNVAAIRSEKASWEIGGNVTFNKNKITKLTATDDPNYLGVFTGDISGGVGNKIQIHSVGYAASTFFVYEQVYDDKGVPIEGLYVDRNGDGKVTPEDRYRYKNPAPKAFFGFYTNYTRGAWDFSAGARANIGNYVYNNVESSGAAYNNLFGSAGYLANVQGEIRNNDFKVPQYFSDHFIQNASFLRFDHITLGYSFGNMSKLKARVYATANNPFLITKYEGLDPEIFGGIDNNIYPRSRSFVVGANLSF
jgi:TonB-linked SusC/RagA family outer membrane protein